MPYIIDGNNLIGSSPDIAIEDIDGREKITLLAEKFQNRKKNNVILVFDGEPKASAYENSVNNKFKILYPRFGMSADELIKKILEECGSKFNFVPGNVTCMTIPISSVRAYNDDTCNGCYGWADIGIALFVKQEINNEVNKTEVVNSGK